MMQVFTQIALFLAAGQQVYAGYVKLDQRGLNSTTTVSPMSLEKAVNVESSIKPSNKSSTAHSSIGLVHSSIVQSSIELSVVHSSILSTIQSTIQPTNANGSVATSTIGPKLTAAASASASALSANTPLTASAYLNVNAPANLTNKAGFNTSTGYKNNTAYTTETLTRTSTLEPVTLTKTVHVLYTGHTKGTGLSTSGNVVYSEAISEVHNKNGMNTDAENAAPVNTANAAPISTENLATTAVVVVSTSAVTKTHTIYVATHSPTAKDAGLVFSTVATTSAQPLISNAIVTKEIDVTVTNTHFTTSVVIVASTGSSESPSGPSGPTSGSSGSSGYNSTGSFGSGYNSTGFNSTRFNSTRFNSSDFSDFSGTLFGPISADEPLSVFKRDQLPLEIPAGVTNDRPYETNKFYVNLFLSEQSDMIWSYPYGLFYDKKSMHGWGISYVDRKDAVEGTELGISTKGDDYYTTPVGVASLLYSATDFSDGISMSLSDMKDMSVNVKLARNNNSDDYIEIPTVQGQGFVTAIYHGALKPLIKSSTGIKSFTQETSSALPAGVTKYKATLFTNVEWLVYVSSNSTANFTINSENFIEAAGAVDNLVIQVAVSPNSTYEAYYDMTAGLYPVRASVEGSVNGNSATYGFKYTSAGTSSSGKSLVFCLPHHLESLNAKTAKTATGLALQSTTKGTMYGFVTDGLFMDEQFVSEVGFAPWSQQLKDSTVSWSADQLKLLAAAAQNDLQASIKDSVSNIDTYTAGKLLDKFAYILYVLADVLKDKAAAETTLQGMKDAFAVFTANKQKFPLMYDTKFGGISTTANNNGDAGEDYGAGYYNDHHFHYGYFVHAAAMVGYVDSKYGNGTWAEQNKDWVNSLVRDVANPSEDDGYFPVSRMFDWFAGHSWAAGLFTSGAGRNEESTSEDYNFAYAMKLWGKVSKDSAMEARGDLMIAVMKRALNDYFYYSRDNSIEPEKIVANRVSGIFYENKIAYTTFFGNKPEYIHGIHMLPITPVSSAIRGPDYVKQEWNDYIKDIVDSVNSGWTGVLRLNQALFDPAGSYKFFSQKDFDTKWLDDGQSLTWCLAFSGALANGVKN